MRRVVREVGRGGGNARALKAESVRLNEGLI